MSATSRHFSERYPETATAIADIISGSATHGDIDVLYQFVRSLVQRGRTQPTQALYHADLMKVHMHASLNAIKPSDTIPITRIAKVIDLVREKFPPLSAETIVGWIDVTYHGAEDILADLSPEELADQVMSDAQTFDDSN